MRESVGGVTGNAMGTMVMGAYLGCGSGARNLYANSFGVSSLSGCRSIPREDVLSHPKLFNFGFDLKDVLHDMMYDM